MRERSGAAHHFLLPQRGRLVVVSLLVRFNSSWVLHELVAVHGCPSAVRSTTALNSRRSPSSISVPGIGSPRTTFNPASRTRTPHIERFTSIAELRALTTEWLRISNMERPHDSLGRVPPAAVSA